ncbi:MAG: hydantoinase/oxoprolinase family protein, partial [Gammaproteobacteria bacterium]|nr:hydantoinase/oxoprolinase family protein [Gammaproteobacteria bacterium]
ALTVPWTDAVSVAAAFHTAHEQRYGHRLDSPVELVNLRVALDVAGSPPPPAVLDSAGAAIVYGAAACPVHVRSDLVPGRRLAGPVIVCDSIATTHIDSGWAATLDDDGNLHLETIKASSPA